MAGVPSSRFVWLDGMPAIWRPTSLVADEAGDYALGRERGYGGEG